jgi:hypothetical protein
MNAETKRMIETTDWDALDEEVTNTTYEAVGPIPPDEERKIRAGARALRRRLELERLQSEADSFQSEVDDLQTKTDSLRTGIDDLVLAK